MTNYQKIKLIIITCFSSLLLLIFYNNSNYSRYVFNESSTLVLDRKTGTVYFPNMQSYSKLSEFKKRTKD
ncbi:MAG: hypothetical protein WC389_01525 [Lutibacter sp.]|jgi:hypothetical protein